jgi:hypothetical protein
MTFDLVKIQVVEWLNCERRQTLTPPLIPGMDTWPITDLSGTSLSIHHLFLGGGYFSNIFEIFL